LTFHITETLKGEKKFEWTSEAQGAFDKLKEALTSPSMLVNPDFSRKFYVHCDASDFGIGAVLVQLSAEGEELPIYFSLRNFHPHSEIGL